MVLTAEKEKNDFESRARRHMERKSLRVSQQYRDDLLRILEADVFPPIGRFDLSTITSQQLQPVLQSIEKCRGAATAHIICSVCCEVFTAGIVAGVCERNPATVARDALSPRIRLLVPITLTLDQFTLRVGAIGGCSASPVIRAALLLSILLLVRSGELCRAEWKDFDLDEAIWRYKFPTAAKAQGGWRFHYAPLSTQAVRLLRELQRITGRGCYVFTAPRSAQHPIEAKVLRRTLVSMGLSKEVCVVAVISISLESHISDLTTRSTATLVTRSPQKREILRVERCCD